MWDGSNWNNVGPFRGPSGAGSPYRGPYDGGQTYYGFGARRDVVYSGGTYWQVQADTGADGSSSLGPPDNNNSNWTQFGGVYDNIATGLVLTRDATITRTLILGQEGTNSGVMRSGNYRNDSTKKGFLLQAENGRAIFNNVVARGELHGVAGTLRDMTVDNFMEFPKNREGTRGFFDDEGMSLPIDQSYSIATSAVAGANPLDVYYDKQKNRTVFDTHPTSGMQLNGPRCFLGRFIPRNYTAAVLKQFHV